MKRKITYYIDDIEWFRNDMLHHDPELTTEQIEDVIKQMGHPFKALYVLIGDKQPEEYKLFLNNPDTGAYLKVSVNDWRLNGYHHMILNDCKRHFEGLEHSKNSVLEGYRKEDVFGCVHMEGYEFDDLGVHKRFL